MALAGRGDADVRVVRGQEGVVGPCDGVRVALVSPVRGPIGPRGRDGPKTHAAGTIRALGLSALVLVAAPAGAAALAVLPLAAPPPCPARQRAGESLREAFADQNQDGAQT
jgi:hypothetical protein